ncbi:MAG: hypothetical protein M3246_07350 [Actinomycetota bacterium]|nr:hypothetical protein [Actinomycetota bacterium]
MKFEVTKSKAGLTARNIQGGERRL